MAIFNAASANLLGRCSHRSHPRPEQLKPLYRELKNCWTEVVFPVIKALPMGSVHRNGVGRQGGSLRPSCWWANRLHGQHLHEVLSVPGSLGAPCSSGTPPSPGQCTLSLLALPVCPELGSLWVFGCLI